MGVESNGKLKGLISKKENGKWKMEKEGIMMIFKCNS